MSPAVESLIILAAIMAGALLGMLIGALVPEHHRSDGTRSHFTATISVVATLTALVLGLAISNSNTIRQSMIQQLAQLSSNIVRMDDQLRHYGPQADGARRVLVHYATQKLEDLFPRAPGSRARVGNAETAPILDEAEDRILALTPQNDAQRWHQAQALDLSNQIATAAWGIAEQHHAAVPPAGMVVVTLWIIILFGTYGFFTPRHLTAVAAMFLSALAVSCAIFIILEGRTAFTGLVRISPAALVEAVDLVRR